MTASESLEAKEGVVTDAGADCRGFLGEVGLESLIDERGSREGKALQVCLEVGARGAQRGLLVGQAAPLPGS